MRQEGQFDSPLLSLEEVLTRADSLIGAEIATRGRIYAIRAMKNLWFADLGIRRVRIQISTADEVLAASVHAGDLIEVRGRLYRTRTNELTINISSAQIIAAWKSPIAYSTKHVVSSGPLFGFMPASYEKLYWHQACANAIREFLNTRGFMEIQTPFALKHYNGGRSFPVVCTYLHEKVGYVRTTMEERMQALVGSGFEQIYQFGNIFRSGEERILFEAYIAYCGWTAGRNLFVDILSHTVGRLMQEGIGEENEAVRKILRKEWIELDFIEATSTEFAFPTELVAEGGLNLLEKALQRGVIKNSDTTQETLADSIANKIAAQLGTAVIINGFPEWSSPLYKKDGDSPKLLRSRLYMPGDTTGAEMGIQENDAVEFKRRLMLQRANWKLPENDDRIAESDLLQVIEGGIPPLFGLATKTDRIITLWKHDGTFDPFNESVG